MTTGGSPPWLLPNAGTLSNIADTLRHVAGMHAADDARPFVVVFLMMAFLFRSVRFGVLAMLATRGVRPASLRALLAAIAPAVVRASGQAIKTSRPGRRR